MTGALFTVAFLVAAGVLLWRKLPRKTFVEEAEPRLVTSHGEIDEAVDAFQCKCGGRYFREGEGPRASAEHGELWRVVAGCSRCDRKRAFLFKLAS